MCKKILVALLYVFMAFFRLHSQEAPQWYNLEKGPYTVGFKTILEIDHSRRYFKAGRPLNLYVWYPAVPSAGAPYMKFGDYFESASFDWGDDTASTAYLRDYFLNAFRNGPLNPSFGGEIPGKDFNRIMTTGLPVVLNAPAVARQFPLLIHQHVNGALHQSVMLEWLASHGFVVVSLSMYGTSPATYGRGEDGPNALLSLTEDIAFTIAKAKALDNVDPLKIAMIGMAAQVGLSLQMKEMPFSAIACLDCSWQPGTLKAMPFYNRNKVRVPILEMKNTQFGKKESFLDSLTSATTIRVEFKSMPHADFYPFPMIAGIKRSTAHANYEIVAKLTLDFLDKVLRADSTRPFNFYDSNDALHDTNILSVSVNPVLQTIPYEEEVLTWLRFGNIEKVEKSLASHGSGLVDAHNVFFTTLFLARDNAAHTVKAVEIFCRYFPSHPNLGMLFNELENNFIRAKTFTNAIEIFSRFAKLMPASPYPHKSLARIYFQLKNRKEAGVHLDRAIEKIHQSSLPDDTRKSLLKEIADMKAS